MAELMGDRYDVVVIGAGLSGLSCARRLQEAGKRVVVLEARNRVGGRTLSQPLGDGIVDLGGQWLGPGQHLVAALADELGVQTFPTYSRGRHVFCASARRTTYRGTIPRIAPLALAGLGLAVARLELLTRRISPSEPWRARGAAALDARTADSLMGRWMRPAGRASFDAAIRTVFGAEASDISLLYLAWYAAAGEGFFNLVEVAGGAQERRFADGAQALSIALADLLGPAIHLDAPVASVVQSAERVVAHSSRGVFEAARVVVALPPPQVAQIDFDPLLPAARRQLVERARMGSAIKVHALYPRAFWRQAGLSGEAVFEDGPLSVTFDNTSDDGARPGLVGFVVGENATFWATQTPGARRAAVLENLRRAFGVEALAPSHYLEHDWSAERYSGGCPVSVLPPGVLSSARAALRDSCGRVHWAGTETAVRYPGYLEGAIEAGLRAATECLGVS